MRFVSRHASINAMQFDGSNYNEIYAWAGENVTLLGEPGEWQGIQVHTNNGTVDLLPGHWLIEGSTDFYPCDPDTFDNRWLAAPEWDEASSIGIHETLQQNTDPMYWAEVFVKTKTENGWMIDDIDEGLMVAWFSNYAVAIERRDGDAV